jgi:glycerate kinase
LLAQQLALPERIRRCDLIVTGEGRLDEQSAMGKVVGAVLEQAIQAQKPLLILCGQVTPAARAGLAARPLPLRVGALCDRIPDVAEAQRQAGRYLEQMAAQELRDFLEQGAGMGRL